MYPTQDTLHQTLPARDTVPIRDQCTGKVCDLADHDRSRWHDIFVKCINNKTSQSKTGA